MPQSPHHLRIDLKCAEWDVKPYYTLYPVLRRLYFLNFVMELEIMIEVVMMMILKRLSYDVCEDYQNCSVLYCVLKLCTVMRTVR